MDDRQHSSNNTTRSPVASSLHLPKAGSVRRHLLLTLRRASALFSRFRALLSSPATNRPAISCEDPAEAYLHVCVASPFFFYVSPAIYGLTVTIDERIVTRRNAQEGDEV